MTEQEINNLINKKIKQHEFKVGFISGFLGIIYIGLNMIIIWYMTN